MKKILPYLLILNLALLACSEEHSENQNIAIERSTLEGPLFQALSSEQSGVKFNNSLTEDAENNYFTWEYFYNGGGVAVVDLDNDGLCELYFTGNMTGDKLYKNKGELEFEDVTASALPTDDFQWHTGVTYADVNLDGFIDLYVCRAGDEADPQKRKNLL